jgi:hypothetical protein
MDLKNPVLDRGLGFRVRELGLDLGNYGSG